MSDEKPLPKWLIPGLALFKLFIHLLTNTNYSFHRDEYLYLTEGLQPAWGYLEIPPLTAFIASIIQFLGGSLFITRLFPALIGGAMVWLIGKLVQALGGKTWAVVIACAALIISPAFLRTHTLFQPVSFNQFNWFLVGYLLVRLVQSQQGRYWYYLGIMAGIGMLTKYSIAFYLLSLFVALLISRHRSWFGTRYPYLALLIALVIASPNLLWQYTNGFPLFRHMEELRETQLVNVSTIEFVLNQFLMNFSASIIWIGGLIYLLRHRAASDFRFLGWAYLFTFGLLVFMSGKPYYLLGAYPILFVFGGLAMTQWIRRESRQMVLAGTLVFFNLTSIPMGLPVFPLESMKKYCTFVSNYMGMGQLLVWEDGKSRPLPQDYADMVGWEEMARRVGKFYNSLTPEQQKDCLIWGGSYGHAGAMQHYREKYQLPDNIYSLSSSFVLWANPQADFKTQILVSDERFDSSEWYHQVDLVDSVRNADARDPGYIYYRTDPKVDVKERWKQSIREVKAGYGIE